MGIQPTTAAVRGGAAVARGPDAAKGRRASTTWMRLLPVAALALAFSPNPSGQERRPRAAGTVQQGRSAPPVPSQSNLEAQLTRFDREYTRLYRLSGTGKNSRYRRQLLSFLSQARQLKGYAQADYERGLTQNSDDVLTPCLELGLVVDTVGEVSGVFGGPRNATSDGQVLKVVSAWLPRLQIGLQQDADTLEFLNKRSGRVPAAGGHLNDPNTLYSEAAARVKRAHAQLLAGDKLGAWLSVAHSSMLLGNLSMRLPH